MQLSNSISESIQTTTVGHYRKLPNGPGETTTEEQSKASELQTSGARWQEGSCMHPTKAKATTVLAPNSKAELLTLVEITWLVCIIFLSHLHKSKVKLLIIYC